jgi:hypothetical protein
MVIKRFFASHRVANEVANKISRTEKNLLPSPVVQRVADLLITIINIVELEAGYVGQSEGSVVPNVSLWIVVGALGAKTQIGPEFENAGQSARS